MADDDFKAITTQDELNKVIGERIKRAEEAAVKPFADYADLKTKAVKFDQQDTANKTEIQKLEDRIVKAEEKATKADERADKAEASSLRSRIQAKHKISDEDAALFLTAADEAGLTAQAEALAGRVTSSKSKGPVVSKEGKTSTSSVEDAEREFVRELFSTAE